MTGNLHEISVAIGELRAKLDIVAKNTDDIKDKLDETTELCIANDQSCKSAHKRLDAAEPVLRDVNDYKNKQIGIVAFVSFVIALIGTGIWKLLGEIL